MSIEIAYYTFDGPFTSLGELRERAGVFCILCIVANGKIFPVDVGEDNNVRLAVKESDRINCWAENCKGTIGFSVLYTPDLDREGRDAIVRRIRAWDYIPCSGLGETS